MLSGRRKLLLADDSPTIRKVISLTFEDEGMEVVSASDGVEALRVLEEQRPDILLADIWMPGPNGYELCERVKRDAGLRQIPVILLVSKFEPFNEAEARRVGADTVLTKPFQSIRDLVSKVGSLLGGGGSKEDEPEAERPRREGPSAEAPATRAQASAPQAESAPHAAATQDEQDETFHHDFEPFADFGDDDELIEAKPADSFGGAPHAAEAAPRQANAATPQQDAAPSFETSHAGAAEHAAAPEELEVLEHTEEFETAGRSPDVFADAHAARAAFGTNGQASAAHQEQQPNWAQPAAESQSADEAWRSNESQPSHTYSASPLDAGEGVMPARNSFAARAAGASVGDDALLDLGHFEPRPSRAAAAAAADDFILDLEEDSPPPPAPHEADVLDAYAFNEQPAASAGAGAFAHADAQSVFAQPDEPSALAEAAHGVPSSSFGEATSDETVPEVVMQDEPQSFATSSVEQEVGHAPRGFVEPSVVPAEEPIPATVESEFTDGSVEGDVPRPPAGVFAAPRLEESAAHEMSAAHNMTAPPEPSHAGHTVGEARAGIEEAARAGQLSPQDVEAVARRVVELMSDKVVREIAWEVVPELAELLVKRKLEEERLK